jgi:hypothetical protein
VLSLNPGEALAQREFLKIWETPTKRTDTLHFATYESLKKYVYVYLNYLPAIGSPCDNGMCSYANTYKYDIRFVAEDAVFRLFRVEKSRDYNNRCEVLDGYLNKLPAIFPNFTIAETTTELRIVFFYHM